MRLQISKSLFSILILTVGLSILVLLRPDLTLVDQDKELEQVDKSHLKEGHDAKQKMEEQSQLSDLDNIWVRNVELKPFFAKKELAPTKVKKPRKQKIPPPPVYVAPPVQPMIPTPQFNYVGRMIDGNQETLFLIGNAGPFIAKQGDVVDGQWRIEHISANSIDMTYLNTNTNFRLNIK
ncbi:hypothetical protein [Acinetobacter proteolyticus]|uniref:Uncharacterized protein n=1 Tax=Acinetobacter proteolyticus TaxID=1776741 RepID=A0A2N0WFE4_9GAMM|nr:hypothetical protein [Acinetobacter proteolyticus]PKF33798.1 hypothetical protein CW311_08085 [Acinetobacter proteolyticus]